MSAKAIIALPLTTLPIEATTIGMLGRAAGEAPDQVAIKQPALGFDEALSWTYAELYADALRMASFLSRHFSRGDHVAFLGANSASWLLHAFAAAHLGIVVVAINPALRSSEIAYMLGRARVKGAIMDRQYRGQDFSTTLASLRGELPRLRTLLYFDQWRAHLAQADATPPSSTTEPQDTALIVFTSSTTGKPKAAMLHHFGLVNASRFGAERMKLPKCATWLATLPNFHVGGTATVCMGAVSQLATLIIMPPFDPGQVLQLIEEEKVNFAPLVPAMLIAMIEHESFPSRDLSSFRHAVVGGTVITPAFINLVREKIGCTVQVVFGQTECSGDITKTLIGDSDTIIERTVGVPLPGMSVKIADPASDATCDVGEIGEIRIRSGYTAQGYFDDTDASAKLYDVEGYLRTGDLGLIDGDGRLRITGRLKEMIIRGGENIYPREIEDALGEFDGVAECAVFGVPHERWGEEIAVAVRFSAPDIAIDDMRAFLGERMAHYKVPRHWRIVDDFPRNGSGKTQKFELQRLFGEMSGRLRQ
jgi:fatty-acyl-CoA synthase